MDTPPPDKAACRRAQRARLRGLCPEDLGALTAGLSHTIATWLAAARHRSVLLYSPLPDEPNLGPLARTLRQSGITTLLPRVADDHTSLEIFLWNDDTIPVPGAFGILEPNPATWSHTSVSAIDAILIPGLAFDPATGIRLGRGAGFYDRLLAGPDCRATPVGVALPWHLVSPLHADPHDQPMHWLATPDRMLRMPAAPASGTMESG